MSFFDLIYNKVLNVIKEWNDNGIYAISFLVYYGYSDNKSLCDFPEFSIGYNTEKMCEYAPLDSEERWNVAFWEGDMTIIIPNDDTTKALSNWYKEIGVENIGYEDEKMMYDEDFNYIGKGPNGYYELLCLVSDVAKRLQTDGTIKSKFGNIPIIVQDLEYAWYVKDVTLNANPNGEADNFLDFLKSFNNE